MFYRKETIARQRNEQAIIDLLKEIGGSALGSFIDMEEIAFHAVKAILPAEQVRHLLEEINSSNNSLNIQLFKFPGVMYFRPTGQSITTSSEEEGGTSVFPEGKPELPAVAAILDGVPNLQHLALKDRVLFGDPDNLVYRISTG